MGGLQHKQNVYEHFAPTHTYRQWGACSTIKQKYRQWGYNTEEEPKTEVVGGPVVQ
jgi:hypothetical protein